MNTENNMPVERAVRISLGLILSTLGFLCVRSAFMIPRMREMMIGMPTRLSELTIFVISHMGLLLLSPVTLSLFGLGFLTFSKKPGRCIFMATIFIIVMIAQWHITMTAFQTPFLDYAMSGGHPK